MAADSELEFAQFAAECLGELGGPEAVVAEAAFVVLGHSKSEQLLRLQQDQQNQLAQLAKEPTARQLYRLGSTAPWPVSSLGRINSLVGEKTTLSDRRWSVRSFVWAEATDVAWLCLSSPYALPVNMRLAIWDDGDELRPIGSCRMRQG